MSFFKYTTISTACLILSNESLRWSSPKIFNDVEECQFVPFTNERHVSAQKQYVRILTECAQGSTDHDIRRFSGVNRQIIHLIQISLKRGTISVDGISEFLSVFGNNPAADFRNYVNSALLNCFRILCVTDDCYNALMWAHYADQHYGCVIEINEPFATRPRPLREGPVRYHENLAPTSDPLDVLLYGETKESIDSMINDIVFSKRTAWSYEKEYRFMFSESFGEITTTVDMQTNSRSLSVKGQTEALFTDVPISAKAVKSITFGARTKDADVGRVSEIVSGKGLECELYRMKMEDGLTVREAM